MKYDPADPFGIGPIPEPLTIEELEEFFADDGKPKIGWPIVLKRPKRWAEVIEQ